jgi:hypothetical protein
MKTHLYIVMDLEPLSSRPWVDSQHLIDLLLVDRISIVDLIALESERENGYRHLHCIIVTLLK